MFNWLKKKEKEDAEYLDKLHYESRMKKLSDAKMAVPKFSIPASTYTSTPVTYPSAGISSKGFTTSSTLASTMGNISMTPSPIVTFYTSGANGRNEVVRVTPEGKVVWANGINVDEAAAAFGNSLSLGTEIAAGITNKVKREMRDSVFADLINLARENGSLTDIDLTNFWEASKIMEKLTGGKE